MSFKKEIDFLNKKNTMELKGSIGALTGEYRKALDELILVIKPLNEIQISQIVDVETKDPDCPSIQNILTHVIYAGYRYTYFMEKHIGLETNPPKRNVLQTSEQFIEGLNVMLNYCINFFVQNPNLKLVEHVNSKKIKVTWGQIYDIDQLMEHAVMHILRHRRQIEGFLKFII